MYTKELLAFVTVADEGSFLKAAKKLYLTHYTQNQPCL